MRANPIRFSINSVIRLACVAGAVVLAACGSDGNGSTGPSDGGGSTPIVYTLTVDTLLSDSVSATVASAVPVRVTLTKAGAPVPAGMVHWKVTLGSGKVSVDSSATDANGVAAVQWTLGDTVGFNTLAISAFDASAVYHAVGKSDLPTTLSRVSADSLGIVAGASLPVAVRVTDRFGNGATGVTINWVATAGVLTVANTPAGANGGAATVFTPPSTGTYNVTATLPNRGSVTFKIVAF